MTNAARRFSRQGHFFGFAFFTADFLAPFFALLPRSRTLLAREEGRQEICGEEGETKEVTLRMPSAAVLEGQGLLII